MHLTFDTAIYPQRSKAEMSTAQVLNTQPYNGRDGRETGTPWLKQGSCFLNCPPEHKKNMQERKKVKEITGKVGIELSSASFGGSKKASRYSSSPSC